MKEKGIRVLLSGVTGLGHDRESHQTCDFIEDWSGVPITLGPPVKPSSSIICDTDVVWPVVDEKIVSKSGLQYFPKARFFVCRHQIQAGD